MSISISYVGEDNTGFPQIVPSLYPAGSGFSPLGKRTRSSSSLSSVFDDNLEEYQPKRKDSQEETRLPFDVNCESPRRADSGISESIDEYGDLDFAGVSWDFGSFGTTPQPPLAAAPALDYSALELLVPFQPHEQQQQLQPVMQVAGNSSSLQPPTQEPRLVIVEEPEEYYRARYESEGVRAPLKGVNDNHPTVKLVGPFQYGGHVKVELVYEDGSLHASCSLDLNEERKNALTKKVGPTTNMLAVFEDLRIRREIRSKKKPEMGGKKNLSADKVTGSRMEHGRNDKVACLRFTATVEVAGGSPLKLSAISRLITLSTPPDPAELDWIRPESGHFQGGDEIVIKGSKMTSPKVTFQILVPNMSGNAQYDLPAVVEKDKSHQNVLLVKTPSLPPALMNCMQPKKPIQALVTVSTGRSTRQSNALQFWFIPDEYCSKCMQQVKMQQPMSAVSLGSSPPPTPSLMDKSSLQGHSIPVKAYLGSVHHHNAPKKSVFSMQHHSAMKQEMLPPSLPPPSSHSQIGQFSSHHPMGLISSYSYPMFPHHSLPPPTDTKLHVDPASTHVARDFSVMETSGDAADFFSYLMQHSDEDTSTSSPEPEDNLHSFSSGLVEPCPNLAPFEVPGQPMCTRATSFGQLSPTSVASPPGCSTPPCYSPITPATSPRQQGAVPLSSGKVELLFNGTAVSGNHCTLALSQLNANHI